MILSLLVLTYFIGVQIYVLLASVVSFFELRRQSFHATDARVGALLSSGLTPPVSIIVPAYNEAAGIVEAVLSMSLLHYPKFEIIVVNDGSVDATIDVLKSAFPLVEVGSRYRPEIATQPVRAVYKSQSTVQLTVIDKENGGKGDAINAGINASVYPFFLATDADMVLDGDCLLRAMRHVLRDRTRVIAVGGNLRPANGSVISNGALVEARAPASIIERLQVLEYIRGFLAARPGWSRAKSLVLISGAFGLFRKQEVIDVGGYRVGHLGEDLELTMRLHRHMREQSKPYRIVYAPDAVAWTEVPTSRHVLRRQRIRWHRGLAQVVWEYRSLFFNVRFGIIGVFAWPAFVLFEFVAPIVEFAGWFLIPVAMTDRANIPLVLAMLGVAYAIGVINSVVGMFFDQQFGYYHRTRDVLRLLVVVLIENFGLRQMTVWWRVRSMVPDRTRHVWGDMERSGVGNLSGTPAIALED